MPTSPSRAGRQPSADDIAPPFHRSLTASARRRFAGLAGHLGRGGTARPQRPRAGLARPPGQWSRTTCGTTRALHHEAISPGGGHYGMMHPR